MLHTGAYLEMELNEIIRGIHLFIFCDSLLENLQK